MPKTPNSHPEWEKIFEDAKVWVGAQRWFVAVAFFLLFLVALFLVWVADMVGPRKEFRDLWRKLKDEERQSRSETARPGGHT